MCRLVDPRRAGRLAACLLVILWTAACSGSPPQAVLTADLPLHLEDHLDAATIIGSEVPEDLRDPVEWRFDEPQPEWQPVVTMNPNTRPVKTERTDDALRLMLGESNHGRGGGNPRGGIVIDLPQWNGWDWGSILVRARSSEGIEGFYVGFNTVPGEPGASRGPNPYEFNSGWVQAVNDGSVQTYLLRFGPEARAETWDRLGLWVLANEPATFEILSVSVVPSEGDYAGAPVGVRAADERQSAGLYICAPGRVEYDVRVPESGRLNIALGVLRDDVPVVFRVRVVPEGGAQETLLDEPWSIQQRWARRRVDLSRFAGQTVRLVLEADAERTGTVAFFGSPTLHTPGRLSAPIVDDATGAATPASAPATFRLWATSDAHVDRAYQGGRLSLYDAITDSEEGGDEGGPAFEWEVALHLGDVADPLWADGGSEEEDGREVQQQLAASLHLREDFYFLAGNHDASPGHEWFRRWIDPTGDSPETSGVHAERRPYPVTGTWERYSFQVGNILFLMMSDRNDGDPPAGRGPVSSSGASGYPAGRVTEETFQWWREMVESNQDKIIVTAAHHMLENTTVGSGLGEAIWTDDEGRRRQYHGLAADGAPEGASFLYFMGDTPHARRFEAYLEEHPGAIDFWLGGHTHVPLNVTHGGTSHIERKWGVTFINVASLRLRGDAKSRLLTFVEGSDSVSVKCYLHRSSREPEGWYDNAERAVLLTKPFTLEGANR